MNLIKAFITMLIITPLIGLSGYLCQHKWPELAYYLQVEFGAAVFVTIFVGLVYVFDEMKENEEDVE